MSTKTWNCLPLNLGILKLSVLINQKIFKLFYIFFDRICGRTSAHIFRICSVQNCRPQVKISDTVYSLCGFWNCLCGFWNCLSWKGQTNGFLFTPAYQSSNRDPFLLVCYQSSQFMRKHECIRRIFGLRLGLGTESCPGHDFIETRMEKQSCHPFDSPFKLGSLFGHL